MSALPLETLAVPLPPPVEENPRLVLVVDDDRRARNAVIDHVRELGYDAIEAATGYEAIKVAALQKPGIVIVDGLLPNMHGFEVSRFIRAAQATYAPRIIVITAVYRHVRYQNEARLKYGIDHYLTKPVSREALASAMTE
jgi:DNA-binding response OmpR family regulator